MTDFKPELSLEIIKYLYENKIKVVIKPSEEGVEIYVDKIKKEG